MTDADPPLTTHVATGRGAAATRRASRRRAAPAAIAIILATSVACGGKDDVAREGAWEFRSDSAQPTDQPTAWLRGTGKEGPQGKDPTGAAILSFDCRADHSGATIMTTQALRQGTTEATLSVGGGPAHTLPGFAGTTETGGQMVFSAPLDSALELFRGGDTAMIQYADGAGSSKTTALFPLEGLDRFRDRFLAACGDRKSARPK